MTWKPKLVVALIASVLGSLAIGASTAPRAASSQRSAEPDDPVAREVRDLRLSLERAASQNLQASVIVMRADASQSRLASLNSELANVRAQLARVSADISAATLQLRESSRRDPNTPGETTPARSEVESRGQLEGLTHLEEMLRETETRLRADISREQAQWNALVARLEGLERSAASGRQ